MTDWIIEPVWQNYSSMYREAVTAHEATTGMEIAHHRMAALYFGISAIESFLDLERRDHLLREGRSHDEVFDVLRNGRFKDKVKKWPRLILGKDLDLRLDTLERLLSVNALRGDLTHQKNFWPYAYQELSETDPMDVVDLVAEFIAEYHHAAGKLFPYWLWGWNYLNPMRDAHDIVPLNNGQLLHSLTALGYKFDPGLARHFEAKRKVVFTDYKGYADVAASRGPVTGVSRNLRHFPTNRSCADVDGILRTSARAEMSRKRQFVERWS